MTSPNLRRWFSFIQQFFVGFLASNQWRRTASHDGLDKHDHLILLAAQTNAHSLFASHDVSSATFLAMFMTQNSIRCLFWWNCSARIKIVFSTSSFFLDRYCRCLVDSRGCTWLSRTDTHVKMLIKIHTFDAFHYYILSFHDLKNCFLDLFGNNKLVWFFSEYFTKVTNISRYVGS